MRLVSWNVNGLRACVTKGFADTFRALDADGDMVFTSTSDSAKTRFMLNFYGQPSSDKLDDPAGKYPTSVAR